MNQWKRIGLLPRKLHIRVSLLASTSMRAAHSHRKSRGPLLLAAAVGAALLFVALRRPNGTTELPQLPQSFLDGVALATSPWPKVQNISDLEVLWELPPAPLGVLFLAHGCSHSGSDFWPKSGRCMHCLGLPEEMRVRQAALRRGYAVVAVSSHNRETMCWHNTGADRSEDLKRVPGILKQVVAEERLGQLPLFAFGASSGGGFVLRLAQAMPEVQGVVCQINPVNPAAFEVPGKRRYPPTIFVHMAQRDPEKAATVTQALAILKKAGTPAAEIKVAPQAVTPAFLQRAVQINATVAEAVVAALREGGFLDEEGQLHKDPRSTLTQWQPLLKPVVGGLNLEPDVSPLAELLNVAYARHEIVSDTTDVTLEWLEAGGAKPGLPGVLQAR
ncbi:hypothetical protein COHA_002668 [Chlorella ohadii]|uniref:Uncharacterized protein n=1 Tax=Chlorella ohadii TaxID=2649997 RepID=A0AAD5H7Y1_9CHLO|nr:hypothetical protein COHA_002668 [Chlorella ohadii]